MTGMAYVGVAGPFSVLSRSERLLCGMMESPDESVGPTGP